MLAVASSHAHGRGSTVASVALSDADTMAAAQQRLLQHIPLHEDGQEAEPQLTQREILHDLIKQ
jgi:hypothetical protein